MAFTDRFRKADFPVAPSGSTRPVSSRKTRVMSAAALFLAACAFGAAGMAPLPDSSDVPVKSISQELALPTLSEQIAAIQESQHAYLREETIRRSDTLAALMIRLGIDDAGAGAFIKSDPVARKFLELKPGKLVQAQIGSNGELLQLNMLTSNGRGDQQLQFLTISRDGDGFTARETDVALEKRFEMRSGEIRTSLFAATDLAEIPDSIAVQIVDMFSTDIDFASDLRKGDRFNVVYETFWRDGEQVQTGRVIAGEFVNGSKTYQAIWFDESGNSTQGGYYNPDGKSLKKAFLKSPIEFSRISSGFSMRVHPISGKWKAHKGVDFAAATGTPIRAAGDGVIDFVGPQGGYGNTVVIKHWDKYSTAYAHMSRFGKGIRTGTKVEQGQVIGYVGSTGWSTGPHLHYEFRVNNEARDPMSIDIPNTPPLAREALTRFQQISADMTHRFDLLRAENTATRLAAR